VTSSWDAFHHALNGEILIVTTLKVAAFVFERHGGEAVAPGIHFGKGQAPEFFRRRILVQNAFLAFRHVDAIDVSTIGRIAIANGELTGIVLRLGYLGPTDYQIVWIITA
jgi:hypothetical protein